jgi:hypothetical protein
MFFLSLSAHSDPALVGEWALFGRTCLSGARPEAFVDPSRARIEFKQTHMTLKDSAKGGCEYTIGPVPITVGGGKVTPGVEQAVMQRVCNGGAPQPAGLTTVLESQYEVNGDKLRVISAPNEEPGVCGKGDSQIVEFKRVR